MKNLVFFFVFTFQLMFAHVETKLTLFTFKDMEEFSNNDKKFLASLMTTLDEERKKCTNHITLLSGDFLSPFCLSALDKGSHVIELLSLLKVDLVSLGNHEFDFGTNELKKRIQESKNLKWIASNIIDLDKKPLSGCEDTFIIEIEGVKIGFLGLIDHNLVAASDIYFLPVFETARLKCEELKKKGAEVIIALTHLPLEENKKLAKAVSDIHFILGGHDKRSITYYVNEALIHNLGEDSSFLSRIDLVIKKEKGLVGEKVSIYPSVRLINVKNAQESPKIVEKIQNHQAKHKLSDNIITLKNDLDATFDSIRTKETVFGNLVADAIKENLGADLSIVNSGIFCSNTFYAKDRVLSKKDLCQEFLFNNKLVLLELKGSDIMDILENSVLLHDQKAPRFPLISGFSFTFDPKKEPSKRIQKVKINNLPIELEKVYKVATVDYLVLGGDGFGAFKKSKILTSEKEISLVDTLIEYFKKKDAFPSIEGRIKVL